MKRMSIYRIASCKNLDMETYSPWSSQPADKQFDRRAYPAIAEGKPGDRTAARSLGDWAGGYIGALVRYGGTTEAGNGYPQALLVQEAWALIRTKNGGALKERYMTKKKRLGRKKP
ncbi:MAG: hypothetical protein LBB48_02335 [Treponema sp.]|nr:hypothetical protein [Treponema sp.]